MASGDVVNLGKGEGWALDVGNMTVRYSCHHKKGPGYGACGGCYARAMRALEQIEKTPADDGTVMVAIAQDVAARCKADKDRS